MEYFVYPENIRVPTGECRGSNVVHYASVAVKLHAVAYDDGKMHPRTVCDRFLAVFPPEEVNHFPWENTPPTERCLECGQATGFLAVSNDTGQVVPGR